MNTCMTLLLRLARALVPAGAALLLATNPARAWTPEGHFLIGAVADRLIAGTPAEGRVRAILDGGTLENASVWSDCVRGVRREGGTFRYEVNERYAECRQFETEAGMREMVRYVERNWNQCRPGPTDGICHDQYHYANVAVQRTTYARGITGTSGHDVVGAVNAAIRVLQGQSAPAPFDLDTREALRVLAHSLGDLHQPIHLASLYLDADGRRIDPDRRATGPRNHTRGSNRINAGERNLHSIWDGVPDALRRDRFLGTAVAAAKALPPTNGPMDRWAAGWATESLRQGRRGFDGVVVGPQDRDGEWAVTLPDGYAERRAEIQREQLVRAGARLAQVLAAIFPR